MNFHATPLVLASTFLILGCGSARATIEQPYAPYTNLHVLPQDVRWAALEESMLDNLRGLGLPRTAGEGCLHCHVGSLGTAMETWDFASDAKLSKRRARVMMQMVRSINETYLAALEDRDPRASSVTCYSCHKGRPNPRPLLAVLDRRLASGGVDAVEWTYRALRAECYGRGVYDFAGTLIDFAIAQADRGAYDDAIHALELNIEYAPDSPDAHRWLVRSVIEQAALAGAGVEELRAIHDSLAGPTRPREAMVWFTLRSSGVRLRNTGRLEEAASVFSLNEQLYPDDHRVVTDLALTQLMLGDTTSAVTGARRALDLQPDYDAAVQLLDELQR